MSQSPTPQPVRRTGVSVDLFVALDRVQKRVREWPGRRQGIVLDVVTETYHRPRRRWSMERHPLAATLPRNEYLHEEYDVPLVLVYRHKLYHRGEPVLMPWRATDEGSAEGARGAITGDMITGEVLARVTGAWPQLAGQMFSVYDQPSYEGLQWAPITDPAN